MTLAERIYQRTNCLYDRVRSPAAVEATGVPPSRIEQLRGYRYCVLISYRRDGTPVATPLWFGRQDRRLYFRTGATTAKLARLRRTPKVRVAPATWRGKPTGPPFVGQAQIVRLCQ